LPDRRQQEQLHTRAPPKVPVTSNATCPQWHDPACVDIALSGSTALYCHHRDRKESLGAISWQRNSPRT
jgi:hypothetical protein